MNTLVINLAHSTDRLTRFTRVNGFLRHLETFPAVEGARVDRERLKAAGLLDPQLACSDGTLGCALSHLTIWQRVRDSGAAITVCEDDAVLNRGFEPQAERLIAGLPVDWDLVLWGWNFDAMLFVDLLPGVSPSVMQFSQTSMRQQLERFQALDIEPHPLRLLSACGTLCYAVSARGADKLISGCTPMKPIVVRDVDGACTRTVVYGVDHAMAEVYPRIKAYAAFPPLAVSANDKLGSTVQAGEPS